MSPPLSFSPGTLNPALQDKFGRPKRDISTIIHILNDLLCATPQYRAARSNNSTLDLSPASIDNSSSMPVLKSTSGECLDKDSDRIDTRSNFVLAVFKSAEWWTCDRRDANPATWDYCCYSTMWFTQKWLSYLPKIRKVERHLKTDRTVNLLFFLLEIGPNNEYSTLRMSGL